MMPPRPFAAACGALALAGCASNLHFAGSLPVNVAEPQVLRIVARQPIDMRLELWNRGPDEVQFRNLTPMAGDAAPAGVLVPDRREFRWRVTATHFELELACAGRAIVAYAIECDDPFELTIAPR